MVLAYPPPDKNVRNWIFSEVKSKGSLQNQYNAFLHALLSQTGEELKEIIKSTELLNDNLLQRLHLLASSFRGKMAEGGEFGHHGPYRVDFYDKVIKKAADVSRQVFSVQCFSNAPRELK